MLATEGLSNLARDYCESIARAVASFPSYVEVSLMKEIILVNRFILVIHFNGFKLLELFHS